jgi:outer membrane biogenesis lipoprotein LolB
VIFLMSSIIRCAFALSLLLFIAGCATTSSVPPVESFDQTAFQLSAKVAVRSPQGNETFRLRWQRRGDLQRIEVLSPIGSTVAELFADAGYAELWKSKDQPPDSAESLDALLSKALNINFNSAQCIAWMHGRVPPWAKEGAEGQTEFEVAQWKVAARYLATNKPMPQEPMSNTRATSLTISDSSASQPTSIRMVIDEYAVLTPSDALPTPHFKK